MLSSHENNIRYSGIAAIIVVVVFILFAWWKGVGTAIRNLIIPAALLAIFTGLIYFISGFGTGEAMLYLLLTYVLIAVMVVVGTISRAAVGSLSNILFLVVALSGGTFGKSIGGGLGAVIVALACAQISKRALSGAKGFEPLRIIAALITIRFGTSFKNSLLTNAHFSNSNIQNTDFTNANISTVSWGNTKRKNCVVNSFIKEQF